MSTRVSFHVKTWGPGFGFSTGDEKRALAYVGREIDRLYVKIGRYSYQQYEAWKAGR